jgi:hypothetical protein
MTIREIVAFLLTTYVKIEPTSSISLLMPGPNRPQICILGLSVAFVCRCQDTIVVSCLTPSTAIPHDASVRFTYEIEAVDCGEPPYTLSVPPAMLPSSVRFAPSPDNRLEGQLDSAGSYRFEFHIKDRHSKLRVAPVSLEIYGDGLTVVAPNLPDGTTKVAYPMIRFAPRGGVEPYSWIQTEGQHRKMPGFTLSDDLTLAGTPESRGSYEIEFTVADSTMPTPKTRTVSFSIQVYDPFIFPKPKDSLPPGVVSEAYSPPPILPQGGDEKYAYTVSGMLAPGLNPDAKSMFKGTPTAHGRYDFSIALKDGRGQAPTPPSVAVSLVVVKTPFFRLSPGVDRAVTDLNTSLMSLKPGANVESLAGKIHEVMHQLDSEFPVNAHLCLDPGPVRGVGYKDELGLLREVQRKLGISRTDKTSALIEKVIDAITVRIHLLKGNEKDHCLGTWTGDCYNSHGVKANATLAWIDSPESSRGWVWRINDPVYTPEEFYPRDPTPSDEWLFQFGEKSSMRGNFDYYPKERVERFQGTLAFQAYGPVTLSCTLNRVHQPKEEPWD